MTSFSFSSHHRTDACTCSFNKESVPEGTSSYDILTKHTGVMHWVDLVSNEISFDADKV